MDNFPTKLIRAKTTASVGIDRGDFIYQTGSGASAVATPVSAITYGGSVSLANAQAVAVGDFLGQSQDMKRASDTRTDVIEIATAGRMVCPTVAVATAYAKGELYGLNGDGTNLYNQIVIRVAASNLAIGVLVEDAPAYATTVCLGMVNTITEGV